MLTVRRVPPGSPAVRFLEDMIQSEYVGMYGEPDLNPAGGLRLCEPPEGSILVGFLDGAPVAMAGWQRLSNDVAVIKRVYTHWAHRRVGLSSKLLTELEQDAYGAGIRTLVLETGPAQTPAIKMYLGAGYVVTEPFGFYEKSDTSVFLSKELTK